MRVGHGTLAQAPAHQPRHAQGARASPTRRCARSTNLPAAFDIKFVFNRWTLGEDFLTARSRLPAEKLADPAFDLLTHLGFSKKDIEAANEHVCGTMTLEGAPHLKPEHYPVFDCANRCGKTASGSCRSRATSA